MLRDYFPTALSFIWRSDLDGQPLHITPGDPGGATSWGVTYATWAGWQQLHRQPASLAVFKTLGKDDFQPLYRAQYWNSIRCSSLGAIGIMMFDCAVNCGPGHAAGFLQTVLGVTVDREIGPLTVATYTTMDPAKLARALCSQREDYYQHCPNAQYFCKGWDRRAEACRDYVLSLLPKPVPPVSLSPKPTS